MPALCLALASIGLGLLGSRAGAAPAAGERVSVPVRNGAIAVTVYRPPSSPKGTVVMGSGDVGWVGLAVTRAQDLAADGYVVVGVNVREYLATFTTRRSHLVPADVQHDFGELHRFLASRGTLPSPIILSGVSEGAGLVVVAAAAPDNHQWVSGVITMGLPRHSELAWRWYDFTSWITGKDAVEPSVDATDFLPRVEPLPLVMIESTRDGYVPAADYRAMEAAAGQPKRLMLIDASNHRFTDRMPELRRAYADALTWVVGRGRDAD
jgi:dienelactone hydrolase